jgi:hypothetical protein
MGKAVKIFFLGLYFASAALPGQELSGYVLKKISLSSQTSNPKSVSYSWVAFNNTTQSGNFFILENVPASYEIQSIAGDASAEATLTFNPALPLTGPAELTMGPFPIAANSSVTFHVTEAIHGNPAPGNSPSFSGETFSLLSDSQLAGKNPQNVMADLSVNRSGTPTMLSSGDLIQSAVAAPNISNGKQPIHFILNLSAPAMANLSLFTVTGERVYDTQAQEGQGSSTMVWNIQNNAHQPVASGLYIYLLKVDGVGIEETKIGKVLIIH